MSVTSGRLRAIKNPLSSIDLDVNFKSDKWIVEFLQDWLRREQHFEVKLVWFWDP